MEATRILGRLFTGSHPSLEVDFIVSFVSNPI